MSWTDDKDLGPWVFHEQPNKWGYLNNRRWSFLPEAVEFSEAVGNEIDMFDDHKPCGHWHKNLDYSPPVNIGDLGWWQPTVDIRNGLIGMVPMRQNGTGIVSMIYDVEEEEWITWGLVDEVFIIYAEPHTARFAEDDIGPYLAYYCTCWEYDWFGLPLDPEYGKYYGRVYIFQEGEDVRYTDVWPSDYSTGDPYEIYERGIYNKMDCVGSRMACAAWVLEVAGVAFDQWQVKFSTDAGLTFPNSWDLPGNHPGGGGSHWDIYLRMSEDGYLWLCRVQYNQTTTHHVQLWRSNAAFNSMSLVWERDYMLDNGGYRYARFGGFDISNTDGRYIIISLQHDTPTYSKSFYVSTDYGASFSYYVVSDAAIRIYSSITAEYPYVNIVSRRVVDLVDGFARSIDVGVNWTFVDPTPAVVNHNYVDMQKHYNEIVYLECGQSYESSPPLWDFQSLLYSPDHGATWEIITSPIPIIDTDDDIELPGPDVELPPEPQVWLP